MSKEEITVLEKYRPLTNEELSTDLTYVDDDLLPSTQNQLSPDNDPNELMQDQYENQVADEFEVDPAMLPEQNEAMNVEDEDPNDNIPNEFLPENLYEMATEVAPQPRKVIPFNRNREEEIEETEAREKSGMAVTGLILSVISLFFLPYVLAPIGIALGYFGYAKGDKTLGVWAMGLGGIGLLGPLIVSTFV